MSASGPAATAPLPLPDSDGALRPGSQRAISRSQLSLRLAGQTTTAG